MTAMMNQWCLWNMQVFRWGLHRERRSGLFGTRFFYVRRNSSSTTTPAADSARSPRSWRSACEDCRSGDQGGQWSPLVVPLSQLGESFGEAAWSGSLPPVSVSRGSVFEPGAPWSARRVLLHVIAETAQHAAHADIIRVSLDGAKSMA